jgi:hypothetical protein
VRSWDAVGRDLVRSGVTWRVHSVFRAAFNLVSDRRELLGIVTAPAGNGPATLVLSVSDVTWTPQLGDPATLVGERLVLGDRLALDLSRAALWDPPPIRRALSFGEILDRLESAVGVAAARAPSAGLAPLLPEARRLAGRAPRGLSTTPLDGAALVVQHAWEALSAIAEAIRRAHWSDVFAPARELSGLGPGLTPSGDDLLVGMALGLRAGLGTLLPELASAFSAAVEGRTTDLAEARVRHAVAGRADEAVHSLLVALVDGPRDRLEPAVRSALAYGHSSGADTLVGLIVGLALSTAPGRRLPGG